MDHRDLDGLTAAPGIHRLLFENDAVRVIETTIAVGEVTPLHTHLTPTVTYVISGSHFVRRDEHGAVLVDTHATPDFVLPKVLYQARLERHTLENTGNETFVAIGVELKHGGTE